MLKPPKHVAEKLQEDINEIRATIAAIKGEPYSFCVMALFNMINMTRTQSILTCGEAPPQMVNDVHHIVAIQIKSAASFMIDAVYPGISETDLNKKLVELQKDVDIILKKQQEAQDGLKSAG